MSGMKEALGVLICVGILSYVLITQFNQVPVEQNVPVVAFEATAPDTAGPVSYFVNNCSRCHGPADNAYAEFTKPRRGEEMKKFIVLMADGPALAPIDPAGVEMQYHLHNAMLDKAPYAWIDPTQTDLIAGELIEGTTVYLNTGTERIKAAITDDYRFVLPKRNGTIELERDGKKQVLK